MSIAIATVIKNYIIRVQNVNFAGKRKSQDEFIDSSSNYVIVKPLGNPKKLY